MANYYELPAQQPYVDTHVDLPSQTMAMLAEAYKNRYEQSQQLFLNYVTTYGDFTSPIAGDVSKWNQQTVGRAQQAIQGMNDPDWLKTPEGQAAINNVIATTNYGLLSKYKLSAENANQYLKAAQSLLMQGKYNQNWDKLSGMSPTSWDTDKNGIFNYTSPIEYQTGQQLSAPYYNGMERGTIGRRVDKYGVVHNIIGISQKDLATVANAKFSDMASTPQGQMYLKQYKAQGMNDDQAASAFKQMIASSNIAKTLNPTDQVDPVSVAAYQANLSLRNSMALESLRYKHELDALNIKQGLKNKQTGSPSMTLTDMLDAGNVQATAQRLGVKALPSAMSNIAYKTAIGTVKTLTSPTAMKGKPWSTLAAMNVPLTIPLNGRPTSITPALIINIRNNTYQLHNQMLQHTPGTDAYTAVAKLFYNAVSAMNSISNAYYNIGTYHKITGHAYNYPGDQTTSNSSKTSDVLNATAGSFGSLGALGSLAYSKVSANERDQSKIGNVARSMLDNISNPMSGDASTSAAETLSGLKYGQSQKGWFDLKNQKIVMPDNVMANMFPRTLYNTETGRAEAVPYRTAPETEGLNDFMESGHLPTSAKFRVMNKYTNYIDSLGKTRTVVHAQVKMPLKDLEDNLSTNVASSIYRHLPGTDTTNDKIKKYYGALIVSETDPSDKKSKIDYAIIPTTIDVSNGELKQRLNADYASKIVSKKYVEGELPTMQQDAFSY